MNGKLYEISDGGFDYPRESMVPADALEKLPPVLSIPYRPLLVDTGSCRILLDTGAGPLAPTTGQLQANLRNAGFTPESIDLVFITHAHADHIGGLLDAESRPAFPNARILIARKEYEFWRHSGIRERLGSGSVYGNSTLESVIGMWFDRYLAGIEDRLEFVDGETEIAPGIVAIPAYGHTPGQMAVLIADADGPLLYGADTFSIAEHITHPEWVSSFDLDAQQMIATRRALLDRAAADEYRMVHYHVEGVGRVTCEGSRYKWDVCSHVRQG